MTDEYRNDNESMEENVTAEGTQTADAADGQQGEQR